MVDKKLSDFAEASVGDISSFPALDTSTKNKKIAATKVMPFTNCITEIPQDINLTLSSGTLTLKAGSKVYIPNGAGVFDTLTITSDLTKTYSTAGEFFFVVRSNGSSIEIVTKMASGSTDSYAGQTYHVWYDTTNNLIKRYTSDTSTPAFTTSFPICKVTVSGGAITSIDQVFNGFGYIGSSVFVLPGVAGLKPNGRNADGTIKTTAFQTSSVIVRTFSTVGTRDLAITGTDIGFGNYTYDAVNNLPMEGSTRRYFAIFGSMTMDSGYAISNFNVKPVFHAADYYDVAIKSSNNTFTGTNNFSGNVTVPTPSSATDNSTKVASTAWVTNHLNNATVQATVVGWAMPKYSTLTSISITSGTEKSFTATKNCFVVVSASGAGTQCYIKSSGEIISRTDVASQASSIVSATAFVKAGDTVKLFASGGTTTSAKWCELYN